jgi:hypothetical protein
LAHYCAGGAIQQHGTIVALGMKAKERWYINPSGEIMAMIEEQPSPFKNKHKPT